MKVGEPASLALKIYGMDCADEVSILKRELIPLVGGEHCLSFDLLNGKMLISQQPGKTDFKTIVEAVGRTGMRAELWSDTPQQKAGRGLGSIPGRSVATALSGASTLAGFLLHGWMAGGLHYGFGAAVPLAAKLIYFTGLLAGGWYILPKAWLAVRRRQADMNLLMTIAALGAIGIGEWFEAATVYFLFGLSLTLESWSVGRARRAVQSLMELTPPSVRVLREDGTEIELPPNQVDPGKRFVVRPGERIPLDGTIVAGFSHVNQAPITGESQPIQKQSGAEVFAGTINGDGALEVESTKPAADTTLAHIVRMVSEAQSHRAPSEQWVDKFARIYTPAVMGLAVAVLLVPPLFFGAPWSEWFYRSLVLLVISCPCALVISTPVSIVAAVAAAAKNGVLVKGGVYMEAPARLRAVAFDKTGTVTEGQPEVVKVMPLNNHSETELLARAAALEVRIDHPLAHAIVKQAKQQNIPIISGEDFQILPGKGASARLNGKTYWLGSQRYLRERGQETPEVGAHLANLANRSLSVVAVGNETHVCGLIAIADRVRSEAKQVVDSLHRAGIAPIVMLTGDNQEAAQSVGSQIGVDEVYSDLLPMDKVRVVKNLISKHGRVAMIGDGINDAPAMASATLGIAMGAAGSDAAMETADIALMSDDFFKLPWLVHHSRRTLRIIRQNISISLGIKVIFATLTFLGQASLWAAIAADMGISLLVILNALRLLATPSTPSV